MPRFHESLPSQTDPRVSGDTSASTTEDGASCNCIEPADPLLLAHHFAPNAQNPCAACPRAIAWTWSSFEDITAAQLYAALRLRQDIFIVEQSVPYPDIDGKDLQSMHLFGILHGELVAYLRALPPSLFESGYASFGRVVVSERLRGMGLGRELVRRCLDHFTDFEDDTPIKISSQLYLKNFYASFGFTPLGDTYIEDLIPHIAMVKN